MSSMIETKFGNAYLNPHGYYRISSGEYKGKLLHRLVFEDFYQINIDEEFDEPMVIHHIDEDKTNNEIWNLDIMSASEHTIYHNKGKPKSEDQKINTSKSTNTTGYFGVSIHKDPTCKQGYLYRYSYYENGKHKEIRRVDLDELEAEVISRGLLWYKFEDEPKEEAIK